MARWSQVVTILVLMIVAASGIGPAAAQTGGLCDRIAGVWTWIVNGDVTFRADGTLIQGKIGGRWFCDPGRAQVVIVWDHGYTDIVALSDDGQRLAGTSNVGGKVGGVRKTASAGTGAGLDLPSDPIFREFFKDFFKLADQPGPWVGGWNRTVVAVTLKPVDNDAKRGALGVRIADVSRVLPRLLPQAKGGAFVVTVYNEGAAAGRIQRGDVITAINGLSVLDWRFVVQAVSSQPAGTTVQVEIWRMTGGFEGLAGALYKAAQADDANATFLLGYLETIPEIEKADPQRTFGFYHRAAALGSVEAMEEVANAYRNGIGVESNLPEATQWYRQAVARGFVPSMFGLATLLATGKVGEVNPGEVFNLMRRAAEGGFALAHYFVASYYDAGYGTKSDPKTGAGHLVEGIRLGGADVLTRFGNEKIWNRSAEFYLALQRRLQELKIYRGALDGKLNAALNTALQQLAQAPR